MDSKDEFEVKNFASEVIKDSYKLPVLVDHWASWCGPCKFLGPIIEKLAKEADGKWKLVKVNTETNPEIAADWGIKGIPNIKLFYNGEVIEEISEAMPEDDLRKWLLEKLPSKAKTLTMEAVSLLKVGEVAAGIDKLEQALNEDESLAEAKILLAGQKVWNSPAEAQALLDGLLYHIKANEIILLANLLTMAEDEFEEGVAKADILLGITALEKQDFATSFGYFINSIIKEKSYHEELVRKIVIAMFHHLGESNEITRSYRRQFDMALY